MESRWSVGERQEKKRERGVGRECTEGRGMGWGERCSRGFSMGWARYLTFLIVCSYNMFIC